MQFNEEFVVALEDKILELTKTKSNLMQEEKVKELADLLLIYQSIHNIKMTEMQTQFMKQSAEQMKNVDFGKLDIKGMLGQLVGK